MFVCVCVCVGAWQHWSSLLIITNTGVSVANAALDQVSQFADGTSVFVKNRDTCFCEKAESYRERQNAERGSGVPGPHVVVCLHHAGLLAALVDFGKKLVEDNLWHSFNIGNQALNFLV